MYISTGSIKLVNPSTGQVVSVITADANGITNFDTLIKANLGIFIPNSVQASGEGGLGIGGYGDRLMLGTSGSAGAGQQSLIFADTNTHAYTFPAANGTIALTSDLSSGTTSVSNLNSFTSSINTTIKDKLNAEAVISGSSQVTLSSTTGYSTFSSSVDSRITTEKGRVDAILLAADADKDSFAEIVTLINSVDTTNDNAFATFYTASNGRLSNLETTTGSLNTSVSNINTFTSSINTTIKSKLNADGVVSGSSQIDATATTNWSTGIKTQLNSNTVVSGSSQIDLTSTTNYASGILTRLNVVGVVSGSSQVSLASTTGFGTYLNQAVLTTSTPTFGNLTINGTITATGDITAYYTSDKRHKNNIQTIPNALEKVSKLNGVTWEWNDDVNEVTKSTPKTGLIAQEVQEVLPEVVTERQDGFLALDYSKMMGLLVEAIKEQQTKIHSLTLEVENLKKNNSL